MKKSYWIIIAVVVLLVLIILLIQSYSDTETDGGLSEGTSSGQTENELGPLSSERPDDMVVNLFYDAQRINQGHSFAISRGGLVVNYADPARESQFVRLVDTELDEVYQLFLDNNFTEIEIIEESVFDADGYALDLNLGGTVYNKDAREGSYPKAEYREQFYTIVDALEQFVQERVE